MALDLDVLHPIQIHIAPNKIDAVSVLPLEQGPPKLESAVLLLIYRANITEPIAIEMNLDKAITFLNHCRSIVDIGASIE
jgi:hypothetical protein